MKAHTEEQYYCDQCPKFFKNKKALNDHMTYHVIDEVHCETCQELFQRVQEIMIIILITKKIQEETDNDDIEMGPSVQEQNEIQEKTENEDIEMGPSIQEQVQKFKADESDLKEIFK